MGRNRKQDSTTEQDSNTTEQYNADTVTLLTAPMSPTVEARTEQDTTEQATEQDTTEQDTTEQATEQDSTEQDTEQATAADTFAAAYGAAIEIAVENSGTIPTEHLAAAVAAYRPLTLTEKATIPGALAADITAAVLADASPENLARLAATKHLTDAFAAAGTGKQAKKAAPVRDVTGDAMRRVAALYLLADTTLAGLDPSDRGTVEDTVALFRAGMVGTVADALAIIGTATRIGRGGKQATASTGERADAEAAGSIPSHIAEAVAAAGRALTVAEIVKARTEAYPGEKRPSGGRVTKLLKAGRVAGVVAGANSAGTLTGAPEAVAV